LIILEKEACSNPPSVADKIRQKYPMHIKQASLKTTRGPSLPT